MTRRINLALQGGGAHGAFTWGVLDRLLEDGEIEIAAISGTSAGALNGAALKAGMQIGGRTGAKDSLDQLWNQIGRLDEARLSDWMFPGLPFVAAMADAVEEMFPFSPQGIAAQLVSPYAWGTGWRNPLDQVVRRLDFTHVCAADGPKLFVSTTNVRTGKIRVFSGDEVSPEVLMASACLPTAFQAVELTDPKTGLVEAFWDGGYAGNPALFPLYQKHLPDDVVIVSINPMRRDEVPKSPLEIQNRINEISFNAALLGELRAIEFVKKLIRQGKMERDQMKDVLIHFISDEALMNELSASSKLSPSPHLLYRLKAAGRQAADGFLQSHRGDIGKRASIDLAGLFG
jgi:NTE family protein